MTALSAAPTRDPAEPSPERRGPRLLLIGAGVVVAVAGLFFYFTTRSQMWLDEALTVNLARLPFSQLRDALKHDGAPPLYYALLHVWTGVLGTGNLAGRSLSGLFMVGAVVAIWFAARRFAGTTAAWIAAAVVAANPYAIRYATEARMYSLVMLLVACGIVAFQRALESPSLGRLGLLALIVSLSIYTQYWAFYLLVVVVALLVWLVWRGAHRRAARRMLVAVGAGLLTFLPWLPTFLYQRAHTGTPWGTPVLPGIPIGYTLRDFAGSASGTTADRQEGWVLFLVLFTILLFGVFARGIDGRRLEIDLRVPKEVRGIAFVGGAGLVVSVSLNYLAGGAFQSRYSAIVFPFFALLVARGFVQLRDPRVLAAALAVSVGLGWIGGVRNVITQRTQAGTVAAVLRKEAKPGDLVVYCPDQIGPSVHRLAPSGLDEVVYPSFAGPERVDWVDYKARLKRADPKAFVQEALRRTGNHTLWYVSAPGYITHVGVCEAISDGFAAARPRLQRTLSDDKIFEKPALQMFPARAGG
ncbi:MAG TPA: glycosyltransferase family 39 protein [Acidimicrobiia bacterium]|nr:glycosyltransferase family 39 protein [Acidimicrobiia bacterium]